MKGLVVRCILALAASLVLLFLPLCNEIAFKFAFPILLMFAVVTGGFMNSGNGENSIPLIWKLIFSFIASVSFALFFPLGGWTIFSFSFPIMIVVAFVMYFFEKPKGGSVNKDIWSKNG